MDNATAARPDAAGPIVLGIETSCDDTACAWSTARARARLGGLEPARGAPALRRRGARDRLPRAPANWPAVSGRSARARRVDWPTSTLVAATRGPGLVGALLVGLSLGKAIAYALGRPFHAVHHLEGHLYSPFLRPRRPPRRRRRPGAERFTGLVLSGGHTALYSRRRGVGRHPRRDPRRRDGRGLRQGRQAARPALPAGAAGRPARRSGGRRGGGGTRRPAGRFGVAALPDTTSPTPG
jgi:N6-L-threonylcarbamoyladenine synthase